MCNRFYPASQTDVADVYDKAETLRGKKAIEEWITKTLEKYKFHFKPLRVKDDPAESPTRRRE